MADTHIHIHLEGGAAASEVVGPKRSKRVSKPAAAPKRKARKVTSWQRYMKNKRTQIKYKTGAKKGRLNLSAMSKKYKKGKK